MMKKLVRAMTGAAAMLFHRAPKDRRHCSGTGEVRLSTEVDCGCKTPETGHRPDSDVPVLGGCYHDGTAWSLGYETAHGEVELDGKTFTSLDTGLDGGAMAALREHRRKYSSARDVPRLLVELKVVKVITHGGDPYKLEDDGSPEAEEDTRTSDEYEWDMW